MRRAYALIFKGCADWELGGLMLSSVASIPRASEDRPFLSGKHTGLQVL